MNDRIEPSIFDEVIDRQQVPALKSHPIVIGKNAKTLFAAGVADMDFKAPPVVLRALQERLDHGVFGYETVPGGLMPALGAWLTGRHNWNVDTGHILRAPNILNALAIAASVFTDEGDGIIVQPPVFFDFFDIIDENKRALIRNPLIIENGRYRMDFADLEDKAKSARTKMIYLCNPHNPVGRVWTADELRTLGDICMRHDVLVVSDEIHGDITYPGFEYTPFASLGDEYADHCITFVSPAKSFNIASVCSAFTVIANDHMRAQFQTENSRLTVNKNNAFSSVAMEAAYRDGGPWLDAVRVYLEDNVNLVRNRLRQLPEIRMTEPEGTFLLWLDFRALNLSPDDLIPFLRQKAKWAVTNGHSFGNEGDGFIRLNIACPKSRLNAALDQLENALA